MPAVMCYPGLWNISHPLIRNYSNYELSACQEPLLKREVKQRWWFTNRSPLQKPAPDASNLV